MTPGFALGLTDDVVATEPDPEMRVMASAEDKVM